MKLSKLYRILGLITVVLSTQAMATTYFVDLGTLAPPTTLGGYDVQGFPIDGRPVGDQFSDPPVPPVSFAAPPATAPVAGNLLFDSGLYHYQVGSGWATWSHGYTGDVYWFDEVYYGISTLTLTLPENTKAFYFYLQPNWLDSFNFEVASEDLSVPLVGTASIDGNSGAHGFGFYTTANDLLSITITRLDPLDTWSDGFAVGEFGINVVKGVPDGGVGLGLLSLVLLGLGLVQRRIHA